LMRRNRFPEEPKRVADSPEARSPARLCSITCTVRPSYAAGISSGTIFKMAGCACTPHGQALLSSWTRSERGWGCGRAAACRVPGAVRWAGRVVPCNAAARWVCMCGAVQCGPRVFCEALRAPSNALRSPASPACWSCCAVL
jgi:hypothetical protein